MQSNIRKKLLEAFAQAGDEFISGQKIAELTGASRTAVWKHIEDLRNEGYVLEAVRKKGYRIVSIPDKMSADSIRLQLKSKILGQQIHFYDCVDTTQRIANELANTTGVEGTIVVADEQTAGKGRLARQWHAAKGKGIWMSILLKPNIPIHQAPKLTLLTAVAVVQGIKEVTGITPQIKWPNDILLNGKKITGILTEMQAEADGIHSVVIGVGINVNQQIEDFSPELRDIATSLLIENGQMLSREELICSVLYHFEELYATFQRDGFASIKALWESYAINMGKTITATTAQGRITGIALGITEDGVLLLKDADEKVHSIYSADIEI
ncbi:biotin--[acetyl-CoA-carboxylase] ligase [Bacillus massiliigorillae]|uniref:biotin--[acetyl-CoA-carboxylase] ligase n=1 Tax=Bacillus massiliigorillae TaxID=1243664 RepID=UPI0003AACB17|nr:biotin--[acetyl-CoA-carboxylase] ligase [Bacillus massiliigorillae]